MVLSVSVQKEKGRELSFPKWGSKSKWAVLGGPFPTLLIPGLRKDRAD